MEEMMDSDLTPNEQKFYDERVKKYRAEGDSGVEAERRAWNDVVAGRSSSDPRWYFNYAATPPSGKP